MRRAIDRRLAAAEETAKSKAPKFQIIRVSGGLPGATRCAKVDSVHFERLPEEAVDVFENRLMAFAEKAKAKTLVIGSLCGCAWKAPGSFEAYLAGPDFRLFDEDGIALEKWEGR
jgi:hypothetical protein